MDSLDTARSTIFSSPPQGLVLDSGSGAHLPVRCGDGATDDTAALVARWRVGGGKSTSTRTGRTTSSARSPLHGGRTRWLTHGAQFYLAAPRDAPNVLIESDVYMDQLKLSFVGGDKDRGVTIRGSDVQIDAMRLVARTPSTVRNYRRRALNVGVEGPGTSNVRLGACAH